MFVYASAYACEKSPIRFMLINFCFMYLYMYDSCLCVYLGMMNVYMYLLNVDINKCLHICDSSFYVYLCICGNDSRL